MDTNESHTLVEDEPPSLTDDECFAVAQLALHRRPFGFTQRDVAAVERAAERRTADRDLPVLADVARRITDLLLPPDCPGGA